MFRVALGSILSLSKVGLRYMKGYKVCVYREKKKERKIDRWIDGWVDGWMDR